MQKVLSMRPVQYALKGIAAGSVLMGTYYGLSVVNRKIFGTREEASIRLLKQELPEQLYSVIDDLKDAELIDLLARLALFRKFHPEIFDSLVLLMYSVSEERHMYYNNAKSSINATIAFKIRQSYQSLIEKIRIFRSIIEHKIETAIEDFDEVAVDFNAYVEQVCNDALQDSYL